MAKTTNCSFCGKEITKGIFNGEDCTLDLGTGTKLITCCQECHDKYKSELKANKKRFLTKFDNMKRATRAKYSEKEIAKLFMTYLEEKESQYAKYPDATATHIGSFFMTDDAGNFTVAEYGKGISNIDITAKDMVKSYLSVETDCHFFDKNDITKIEYAKNHMGSFDGLFHKIYSFAIRLNDESVMTYKPCVTRTSAPGTGFGFGYQKSAEKKLIKQLEEFKQAIGSDLPIVKVKKI